MSQLHQIKLDNFTSFEALDLKLSAGVNVLIGANGTGKTHLMKVLYAACAITMGEDLERSFAQKLRNVFNPYEGRMGRLARRQAGSIKTRITISQLAGPKISAEFSNHTAKPEDIKVTGEVAWKKSPLESSYIPVKEMLAHAPGFLATASRREIAFEEVYVDIIKRAFLPKLMGPVNSDRLTLLNALQKAIDGKVVAKGEYFFLKNKQGDLEFTLLAEGIRKLALIWLLIQNGTLQSGSILFWDEPEANLNPALMGQVVEVILALQRLGVQVVMSTHNYVLLKEFDLRKKPQDQIRYVSLYRNELGSVSSHDSDNYRGIDPNAIADTFTDLYERDMLRSLRGA
jgi:ABC-type ATPase involved in cell division